MRPLALISAACCLLAAATAQTFEVSPTGPISSLPAARDAVRAARRAGKTGPATVRVRPGNYRLTEPLTLTAEDSNVTYIGDNQPAISGGRPITGWTKAAKGPLWTAKVDGTFLQLFVNGRRAQRARTPNQGFFRMDGPSSQEKPFLLKFRGDDIKPEWAGKGVEVVGLLAWADIRMTIASVDAANHTATLSTNPRPSNKEKDARYWIENTPDALDSAGEWYLDRNAQTVSYWPLPGEDLTKIEVIAPALPELVHIENAHHIVFRNFRFQHNDWTLPPDGMADTQAAIAIGGAFKGVNAKDCAVEDSIFNLLGTYAVEFGAGSQRNRVLRNKIFDIGAGGVRIGDAAMHQNEAERSRENVVSDNDIYDLGVIFPPAVGVLVLQSSYNTISHNHIHDLYYTAISVGWTWGYKPNQCDHNIIEFNHLHHIGRDMLSDMGAIYTLGSQQGSVIRNNLIHDVWSFTYGGWGIYPDEGSTGILIENNIVYRTKSAGFHQHYGKENIVRNNIFSFGHEYQLMRTRVEPHLSFSMERNIVYFDHGRLLGSNWTGEGYRFKDNIFYDVRQSVLTLPGNSTGNLVTDPLFVDPGSYNFALRKNSPALKLGFKPIDMSTVGPRLK